MTTPPELPEEPTPFEPPDQSPGPIPPPPPLPNVPSEGEDEDRRFDTRAMLWTAGIILVVIAVASWLLPPAGLLVPVALFVSLFFLLNSHPTVRYRSVLAGVLLGLGLGLFVTAGVCTAVLNGSLSSPTFNI
jgi:hypothetical protein